MQIDHPKQKCANPACGCDVEAGHPYCSEHCRTAAEHSGSNVEDAAGGAPCSCGHDGCGDGR
jgi:hypothetical protein